MSTWHQDRAAQRNPTPLWHETKWTCVSDKPGQPRSLMRWDTYEQAKAYADRTGDYILKPAPGGAK